MKASILRALATLGLSAAIGPVSSMAQTTVHARIPFDFTIGSRGGSCWLSLAGTGSAGPGSHRVHSPLEFVIMITSAT
jgi:hypothetical protein